MGRGSHETEIKLPADDAASARDLLYRAGFRVYKRRRFEDNTMFDTPAGALRTAATALRVRKAGGKSILTFKGRPAGGKHKSREELEVEVSSAEKLRTIVARLGFEPVFRYQKYRTEYKQASGSGVATLDETPIGVYLELEGQPGWIDRVARKLGFSEQDYLTSSYGRLYLQWRERHARTPKDMLFR
jgi:adenylate cyclase, class 2